MDRREKWTGAMNGKKTTHTHNWMDCWKMVGDIVLCLMVFIFVAVRNFHGFRVNFKQTRGKQARSLPIIYLVCRKNVDWKLFAKMCTCNFVHERKWNGHNEISKNMDNNLRFSQFSIDVAELRWTTKKRNPSNEWNTHRHRNIIAIFSSAANVVVETWSGNLFEIPTGWCFA